MWHGRVVPSRGDATREAAIPVRGSGWHRIRLTSGRWRLDIARSLWDAQDVVEINSPSKPAIPSSEPQFVPSCIHEEMQAALDHLSRQAFESGLYDCNVMPEGGTDE